MKIIVTEDQFEKLKDGGLDYIDSHWKKYTDVGQNIRKIYLTLLPVMKKKLVNI
jgi:hypothetical protein